MKKCLCLIFIISFFNSTAQIWSPSGAEWTYYWHKDLGGRMGLLEYKYLNDTVIQNKSCKKINSVFRGYAYNYPMNYTIEPTKTHIAYFNNNVLYLYYNNNFDTIINFNANIGDKWTRTRSDGWCDTSTKWSKIIVRDTGHVLINGISLRKISTSYIFPSNHTSSIDTLNYDFIERICFFDLPHYCEIQKSSDPAPISFNCYKDDFFQTYSLGGGCKLGLDLNIIGSLKNVKIFPIPSSGILYIETEKPGDILISNYLGQIVLQSQNLISGEKLDLRELSQGIYFLQIFDKEKLLATERLIKE